MTCRFNKERRGTALIVVLVCMIVASTIVLGSLRSSLRLRRQAGRELQVEQTLWLLDFGVKHAIAKLEESPDYEGESFVVNQLPSKYRKANIAIEILVAETGLRQMSVRAQLTGQGERGPQTQRSVLLPLPPLQEP